MDDPFDGFKLGSIQNSALISSNWNWLHKYLFAIGSI